MSKKKLLYGVYNEATGALTHFAQGDHALPDIELGTGALGAVSSVNGHIGAVNLVKSDLSLANVDNTSDVNKPVSTATTAAIAAAVAPKLNTSAISAYGLTLVDDTDAAAARATLGLESAAVMVADTDGTMAANSDARVATQAASRTYIAAAIAALVASSPATLDTLNELATALGNDPNFATTIAASIGAKLNASAVSAFGLTLIDDADAATARATLGALASSAVSAFGLTLVDDADAATARATLGLAALAALANGSNGQIVKMVSGAPAWAAQEFVATMSYSGVPTASQVLLKFTAPFAMTLPANMSGSKSTAADAAATGSTVIDVKKNGASIATLTYAGAGTVPTLATSGGSAQSIALDDVISFVAPASADATLSGIYMAAVFNRG